MKFVSFIASTMLIVLISQHSTIALPLNETAINGSCSEGFEMIEGRCMPIQSKFNDNHIESSSFPSQSTLTPKEESASLLETSTFSRFDLCPQGTVRGVNGICEKVEFNDQTQFTSQPTDIASTKLGEQNILQSCPEGTRRGENGVCEKINEHETTQTTTESSSETTTTSSTTESYVESTTLSSERSIPERCPKGRRLNADGVCEKIRNQDNFQTTTESELEITTTSTERSILKDCPEGTVRGANGLCENVEFHDQVPTTSQATNDIPTKFGEQDVLQRCPKGTRRGADGVCEKIKDQDKFETTTEFPDETTLTTTEQDTHKDCPEGTVRGSNGACEKAESDDRSEPKNQLKADSMSKTSQQDASKRCPKGQKLNADGVCEKIKVQDDSQGKDEKIEETSTKSAEPDIPKGCPEGTEPDEQGACIGKKPYTPTKTVSNLKVFLNQDGSCPENYKMIEGRCLYVKPKRDGKTLFNDLTNYDNTASDYSSKNLQNDMTQYESVPVLEDNSCPKGTQYSSYGICRRIIPSLNANTVQTGDAHCPPNYELIKGKCLPKKSQVEDLMDLTTKAGKTQKSFPDSESSTQGWPTRSTTKMTSLDESIADVQQPEARRAA